LLSKRKQTDKDKIQNKGMSKFLINSDISKNLPGTL